jgi:hypothetical protein
MRHTDGEFWVIYYCCLCARYFIEGSGVCNDTHEPWCCCHKGDQEIKIIINRPKTLAANTVKDN